jgi:AraC-like DNA-binding protein
MKNENHIEIYNLVNIDAGNDPEWAFPLHQHERQVELSLVLDGEVTLYYRGQSFNMRKGEIAVKNRGVVHAEKSTRERPVKQICISVSGVEEDEGRLGKLIGDHASPVFDTGEYFDLLRSSFEFLRDSEGEDSLEGRRRHVLLSSLDIVSQIVNSRSFADEKQGTAAKKEDRLKEILDWIDLNYEKKITLDMLSKEFYISRFYLDRKFKELTGYSVNRYVTGRKIGEAQRMLIFDDISIKEIALSVGYPNVQYFYQVFKKYTGMTPAEFKGRYR